MAQDPRLREHLWRARCITKGARRVRKGALGNHPSQDGLGAERLPYWAVALWLDNERDSYDLWTARARELLDDQTPTLSAVQTLARELKESHEEAASARGETTSDVFTDLLNAALSEVDWAEIAEHFFEK
jgi:hypothetical protein